MMSFALACIFRVRSAFSGSPGSIFGESIPDRNAQDEQPLHKTLEVVCHSRPLSSTRQVPNVVHLEHESLP
jgi:hypothetical protein